MVVPRAAGVTENDDYRRAWGRRETPLQDTDLFGSLPLRLNVSERTLWRLLSAGKLPKPVRFGRNTRWKAAEVTEWIERGCPVDP
jgi:excisionase family DNA binding protein